MSQTTQTPERELLDEQFSSFSTEELDLLFDEDESKLEEREAALAAIRSHVAAEMIQLDKKRQDFRALHDRSYRACLTCGARRTFDTEKWEMTGKFYFPAA